MLLDVHALKVQTKVVACCPQGRPCFRMCWNQGVFVEMLVVGDGRGGALVPTLPSADLLLVKLVHVQPWLAMSTASLFTPTMTYAYCQKSRAMLF